MRDLNISKVDAEAFSTIVTSVSDLESVSQKLRDTLDALTSETHAQRIASLLVLVDSIRRDITKIAGHSFKLVDDVLAEHKRVQVSMKEIVDLDSIDALERTFTLFADKFAASIELPTHAYRLRLVPSLQVEAKLTSGLVAQLDLYWPQDFSRVGQHIKSALRTIKQRNDIWTPLQLTDVVLLREKNHWRATTENGVYDSLLPAYRVVIDQKTTTRYTDVLTGEFVEHSTRTSQRPNDNDVTKGWLALSAQVVKNHTAEEVKDDDSTS